MCVTEISLIILAASQQSLTHTVYVLFAFVFALTHIDVSNDFLPSCFFIELTMLLLEFTFSAYVFFLTFTFLGLLAAVELF